ncbi:MAG: GtrA family protein [Acidobacteriota bacterium]
MAEEPNPDLEPAIAAIGWHRRLLDHFPPGQFFRYLCVGIFNTIFGPTLFFVFNYLINRRHIPASYMYAAVFSNLISITVAYLGYKFFVFRTKGNYLREWIKAMGVYGTAMIPTLVALPFLVHLFARILPHQLSGFHRSISGKDAAPYVASLALTCFTIVYGFFGHKNVTFRERKQPPPLESRA